MNLPTPEGYVATFLPARGRVKDVVQVQQKLLADYTYVTFEATLVRWREFLQLKVDQPRIFGALNLSIDSDYKKLSVASKRIELNVTPDVPPPMTAAASRCPPRWDPPAPPPGRMRCVPSSMPCRRPSRTLSISQVSWV